MVAKAAVALLAFSVAAGPAMAASPAVERCPNETEVSAFEARQVQIEFMVAALSCQGVVSEKYNNFMRKFGPSLNTQSQVFQGYFRRSYGRTSTREVDSYLTSTANDVSERALQTKGFCTQENAQLDSILAPAYVDLTPATLHAVEIATPPHPGCRVRPAMKTELAAATPAAPVAAQPAATAPAAAPAAAVPAPVVTAAATPAKPPAPRPTYIPHGIVVSPDGTPSVAPAGK